MPLDDLLELIRVHYTPAVLPLIALSAMLEYVFPPFPGDAVTLASSLLIVTGHAGFAEITLVLLGGTLAGAALDYGFGRWLVARRGWDHLGGPGGAADDPRTERARQRYLWLRDKFERHGAAYLVLNRFLPGVRAFVLVAAGVAGLPIKSVLLWSGVSAVLFNLALLGAGAAVGGNWERLMGLWRAYGVVAWAGVGATVIAWIVLKRMGRLRIP